MFLYKGIMKKVNIAKQMRQVRWTTEHTLTDADFRKKLAEKFERAKVQSNQLRKLATKTLA